MIENDSKQSALFTFLGIASRIFEGRSGILSTATRAEFVGSQHRILL